MVMNEEVLDKLKDFIDVYETEYGDVEGFEVTLEHPIVDGERQAYADIKEFIVKRIVKEQIKIK